MSCILGVAVIAAVAAGCTGALQNEGGVANRDGRVSRPGEYAGYSSPTYDGRELTSFYVPVRDGTRLAVDLWRPTRAGVVASERLPVVWMHSPYNRRNAQDGLTIEKYSGYAAGLIPYGYNVAVVDFRGLFASFGTNAAYNRGEWMKAAQTDAYDITEWLARQPWSNGKVGMWGCSATGGSQLQAATTRPPSLKAIFPLSHEFDVYAFRVPGGVSYPPGTTTRGPGGNVQAQRDSQAVAVDGTDGAALLKAAIAEHGGNVQDPGYVPFRDSRSEALGGIQWWLQSSPHTYLDVLRSSGIGVYAAANWDEGSTGHGPLFTFNNLPHAKLLLGPGRHCDWVYVRNETGFDVVTEELRFFDYWLKGIENGVTDEPAVTYYTYNAPGGNQWRTASSWPLPNEVRTRYALGEGSLGTAAPAVPGSSRATAGAPPRRSPTTVEPANGGLAFVTEPLPRELEVTGHPVLSLRITSSIPDVDIYAVLEDLAPDGTATSYQMNGQFRASHRATAAAPFNYLGLPWHTHQEADAVTLVPGEPAVVEFELLPMSYVFPRGHRIRLRLQFADPSGRPGGANTVNVLHGRDQESVLTLPVIPEQTSGPYPAIYEELGSLPAHVVYRPADLAALGAEKLPIYAYGNGGCSADGLNSRNHLLEIASHGYLAIAPGTIPEPGKPLPRPARPASGKLPSATSADALREAIDWAIRENGREGSPFQGRIATDQVAVSGWSCGGLQALLNASDPRVKTAVIMNSGIFVDGSNPIEGIEVNKSMLGNLHGSILYVLGGPTDGAYPNGMDDYRRISGIPAAVVNIPVGHGGTFGEPNGGLGAQVTTAWLDWQLKGKAEAARQFRGVDCGYCRDSRLTMERKHIE